jgi:hypothetical protein
MHRGDEAAEAYFKLQIANIKLQTGMLANLLISHRCSLP